MLRSVTSWSSSKTSLSVDELVSHRGRIQTRSGDSLPDQYDVAGSTTRFQFLDTEEVKTVHEMGGVFFSERASARIRNFTTGNVAQSTTIGVNLTDIAGPPFRLYGVRVVVDITARISNLALMMRSALTSEEFPIWMWDETNEDTMRFDLTGTGSNNRLVLRPQPEYSAFPIMGFGDSQPFSVGEIILRGASSAFGAGNVVVTVLVYEAHATSNLPGSESFGTTLPAW